MRTFLVSAVVFTVLMSCNTTSKKSTQDKMNQQQQTQALIGKWTQPISGQPDQLQGFELQEDHSAISINTNTIKYVKWQNSQDTLFLMGYTVGVAVQSVFTDTLLINKLSDAELIISYKGGTKDEEQIYEKQK